MQFSLSGEQQMLTDSVARFVDTKCSFEARVQSVARGSGGDHWRTFADNGWLGAALPVEVGGFGGGPVEMAIISEQLGRALVIDPWVGCGIMALQLLQAAGQSGFLTNAIEGQVRVALAYSEPSSRGLPHIVTTRGEREADGWRLHGRKTMVIGGPGADWYIVSARISGDLDEEAGIGLFMVPNDAPGLTVSATVLHDGSGAAELHLDSVRPITQLDLSDPYAALSNAVDHGIVALCAELVGAMERAIEITADYLRTRQQFGVALATFQSLQHRLADMAAAMELARSMMFAAIASLENDAPNERRTTISSAKMLVSEISREVCGQAIQLHGGIGMTEEHVIGHYFKRAVVADTLLGGRSAHEALIAAKVRERVDRAA